MATEKQTHPFFGYINVFSDRLLHYLQGHEPAVLLKATRQILGWKQHADTRTASLSYAWFLDETHGLSIGKRQLTKALNALCQFRVLQRIGSNRCAQGQRYYLATEQEIDWDGLRQRLQTKAHASKDKAERFASTRLHTGTKHHSGTKCHSGAKCHTDTKPHTGTKHHTGTNPLGATQGPSTRRHTGTTYKEERRSNKENRSDLIDPVFQDREKRPPAPIHSARTNAPRNRSADLPTEIADILPQRPQEPSKDIQRGHTPPAAPKRTQRRSDVPPLTQRSLQEIETEIRALEGMLARVVRFCEQRRQDRGVPDAQIQQIVDTQQTPITQKLVVLRQKRDALKTQQAAAPDRVHDATPTYGADAVTSAA